MSGLLVVTAHPDDEVLIAGGTLASRSAEGDATAVVSLTRGEHGPIARRRLATRRTLGDVREAELHAACAELGVGFVKCYRRQDGNLSWSDGSAIARQLERVIRQRRPDTVITFGSDGLYYHPDHVATFRYTLRAVARMADPPRVLRSVWPDDLMSALVAELRRRELPADLWDLEPEDFGVGESERAGEEVVDVRRFVSQKLRALRCHRTQLGPAHAFSVIPADLAERFLGFEKFVEVPVALAARA